MRNTRTHKHPPRESERERETERMICGQNLKGGVYETRLRSGGESTLEWTVQILTIMTDMPRRSFPRRRMADGSLKRVDAIRKVDVVASHRGTLCTSSNVRCVVRKET